VLNSRERAQLHAIEAALRAEDPAFVERLAAGRVVTGRGRRFALALLVLGVVGIWLWLSGAVALGH
jgi:hypothetical protein